ncbi:MAG TPA: SusD/RagB family nutrient-binding outer membrane lipoprotein [Chitinophaga sp.]|uniref:SusD/RagB family nutrient-binding outer membrane lipoprotein n=1 Tax=Chitinophaga sp. TaxID=1869181 RepID=UPI002DBAD985|nr:SusD/RagB family nutrient-binding outer membrane lipoprotein [Chitinophaga sp.]HEU4553891.1 SusD/RagB family nutrient-binding outer membrane lipoprotein [Chitinophaga sp.]
MKRLIIAVTCCSLFIITGCKKYLDVNKNPNISEAAPLNGLLGSTTYNTAYTVYRTGNNTSYFVQYLASPNTASSSDTYDEVDYSGTWEATYNTMADLYDLIHQADSTGAYGHAGAGRIMLALNLSIMNSLFGAVPYKEALSGNFVQPHYDEDKDVYASCLSLIDEGLADLAKPDPKILLDETRDLIHHGDTAAWRKTGYALKARLLTRITKTADYDPAQVLAALNSAYTGNSDDAQITQFQSRSPWNQAAYNNTQALLDGWLSTHFVAALNDSTFGVFDPRLPLIADTTRYGDYRGTINGKGRVGTGTNHDESYLSLNGFYSKGGAPLILITYAECRFIAAEAYFRAGDKHNAYIAYQDGIRANMDKIGVSAANRDAYVNNAAVSVGEANITLALIMKEKYVAMFLNPEAWVDARRFDYMYKDFHMPENAVLDTYIRRVAYPSIETSRNAGNVPAVGSLADRLWWDE